MRKQLEVKVAKREKEKQEEKLRKLAQKAREARAGIQNESDKSHDEKERDQLRYERHKDREKQRRIAKAAPDKRYVEEAVVDLVRREMKLPIFKVAQKLLVFLLDSNIHSVLYCVLWRSTIKQGQGYSLGLFQIR